MAVFSAGDVAGIDFTTFDVTTIAAGDPTPISTTVYRLTDKGNPNTFNEYIGSGFTYDGSNKLIDGTITDIAVVENNKSVYEISGLDLPVTDLNTFVAGPDSQGFLAEVFAGSDTLVGSTFADHLLGFAGTDNMGGDDGNDTLEGGAGNDTIDGGAGDDSMDGGDGSDLYFVDSAKDVAIDTGPGTDTDTLESTVSYKIDSSIENPTLLDTAVSGTGNASNNVLIGDAQNNTLDGAAGADTMKGGIGSDTYIVDDAGDQVIENKGEGTDLVKSSVTFTLGANIENLTLTGTDSINGAGNEPVNVITGNGADNKLQGFAAADTLTGNDGNDTLDGGLGNDRMIGGLGNDTYVVDSVLDVIVEKSGEGSDTVQSSVTFKLDSSDALNNLELEGILNLSGTGNGNANHIVGNAGNNILDGVLNTGSDAPKGDTIEGGAGDDTYIVHNVQDLTIEGADAGHDTISTARSWTLDANFEDLLLTGTAAINGGGNELANKITGNAAANKLDGGAGDDTMIGGAGDDTYVVDSAKDVITDSSGVNDEVFFTGKDPTLVTLYTGIEHYNFSLLDPLAGPINFTGTTAANKITGTTLDDTLIGGTGNDTLLGGDGKDSLDGGIGNDLLDGGTGDDTMVGGAGNDTYVIDSLTDSVIETGKDTGDTVQTAGSLLITQIDLTDTGFFGGIENVKFTGTADLNAIGTAGANVLTGNDGDNLLQGNDGNDTLIGGAGNDTLAGDDSLGGGKGSDSMAGGAGDDDYIVNSTGDKIFEAADSGDDTVRSTINYVLGANLNNLVLIDNATFDAKLNGTGNELANDIRGTGGDNVLDGKGGTDTLQGFGGNDTYIVDDKTDLIVEAVDGGHDTVKSSNTYSLAITGLNVEDLVLTGTAFIDGTGNDDANVITGNSGNNKIDGGAGADTMKGGAGDDTYTVDSLSDVVTEIGGGGLHDTVIFQLTDPADQAAAQKLITGIENYDFSKFTIPVNFAGDAAGNAITGAVLGDSLAGNGGNDTLDGGVGPDTMVGGLGNDTYVIDTLADQFVEAKNGGTDTIVSLLKDYTLPEPDPLATINVNVENLTLGDTDDGNGTGNSGANLILGNAFDNYLKGMGGNDTMFAGSGDDTLEGGDGNDSLEGGFGADTYILESKGDRIIEAPGTGIDTVIAPFDYTLGANMDNLTLTGTAKNGFGNTLDNHIVGDDLDNLLDGKGGIDSYAGGKGNDTYILRSINETITENADEGIDTVKNSWKEYHLSNNVENLIFTAAFHNFGTGNASDNLLVGNSVSDTLQGDAGNDTLNGGGGGDSMVGGTGNDTYIVDNVLDVVQELPGGNIDTIQASISIDLANYKSFGLDVIENVHLTGTGALSATGSALANDLIGNTGANKLIGNGGDDTLDGGAGGDSMVGGAGNDTYIVDNMADKVDETGGTGTDTVLSSITFNLTTNGTTVKGDFENLTLTGTGAINGTGNTFNNVIHGNDGANKLDGGAGNDTITGHGGNYTIDAGNGNDTVSFVSKLDGHDVISNFDGDAAGGGQDTVDLDGLFDSLGVAAADRAGLVTIAPGVGAGTFDVKVDVSALHDGSDIHTVATLNLANPADAITVGQDVLVGT